jgi:hypothetical protein
MSAAEAPTVRRPGANGFERADAALLRPDAEPLWLDVGEADGARELLRSAGRETDVPALEALLDPGIRETWPMRSPDAPVVLWGFGACAESEAGGERFTVTLQPVALLALERLVVTHRPAGTTFVIDPREARRPGKPVDIDRLAWHASLFWRERCTDHGPDRDLLLFSLLHGLVVTLFEARAQLGKKKAQIDAEFFEELARSRRRAAQLRPTVDDVADVALRASLLIDRTRDRLNAIQVLAVEFREWFDSFKPAGRLDWKRIWLDDTSCPVESEKLVQRIYQVRNDLGQVRRDVHESMALLANVDTGGQLLAVRALLDRTDSARRAGIVAASLTILLASIGLGAAIAAIPGSQTRFSTARAAGGAGFLVLVAVLVGVVVAAAAGAQLSHHSRRLGAAAASALALVALALFALVVSSSLAGAWVGGALAGALLALVLATLAANLGTAPHLDPAVAALERFMKTRQEWTGTSNELLAALRAAGPRPPWLRRRLVKDDTDLAHHLRDHEVELEALGLEVRADERLTISKRA